MQVVRDDLDQLIAERQELVVELIVARWAVERHRTWIGRAIGGEDRRGRVRDLGSELRDLCACVAAEARALVDLDPVLPGKGKGPATLAATVRRACNVARREGRCAADDDQHLDGDGGRVAAGAPGV